MEVKASDAVPGFDRDTICAALVVPVVCEAKVRVVGESIIPGVGAVPVPLSATLWGDPVALSVMVSDPVRLPAAVGVNVTETLHDPLAAKVAPQVCVCAKSPDVAIDVNVSAAVPEFVTEG
jgi:hypothetical protein